MHQRSCLLPHTSLPQTRARVEHAGDRCISINISGTECYDVSSMGSGKGLAGVTCKTLSVWLAQRGRAQEDLILHECTPRFQVAILRKYLDMYDWMELPLPGETISPHQLGWGTVGWICIHGVIVFQLLIQVDSSSIFIDF